MCISIHANVGARNREGRREREKNRLTTICQKFGLFQINFNPVFSWLIFNPFSYNFSLIKCLLRK